MSDTIAKLRELLLSQSRAGRLRGLLDSIYGAASTGAEAYGAANSPMAPEHAAGLLGTIADLTPVVGDVKSAYEGVQAAREGDWTGAGLGMLGALPFVPGITAWHGSPHKFDKFDMSKIGTGEGAQAYGHGLYMAETPEVAKTYQQFGSWQHRANGQAQPVMFKDAPVQFDNMGNVVGDHPKGLKMFLSRVSSKGDYDVALNEVKQTLADMKASGSFPSIQGDLAEEIAQATANKSRIKASGAQGNLYKVDIPDEAVARFLDWDKPLSQQAPEVQAVLQNIRLPMIDGQVLGKTGYTTAVPLDKALGQNAYDALAWRERAQGASDQLKAAGIPGIRYLDGGSRGAGNGTSNFVLFDDKLPRILERNGQPTGLLPWSKGEWKPK